MRHGEIPKGIVCGVVLACSVAACSSSSSTSGTTDTGTSSGADGSPTDGVVADVPTGGGDNAVSAPIPSGAVAFSGEAVAFYLNPKQPSLQIVVNEGAASCTATPAIPSASGKHLFELDLVGVAGTSAPLTTMTYSSSNSGSTYYHAEAYVRTPCPMHDLAGNGGATDYSVTLTAIDATHVAGTYTLTMTDHVPGGKTFVMSGSFSAPICSKGVTPTCS